MTTVYDAGVLIAAERNTRSVWASHKARLELGIVPVTTAPVIAQVSRSPEQASLHRLLKSCEVAAFEADQAAAAGALLAQAKLADVVDAHVVLTAARVGATVLTSDVQDLTALAGCLQSDGGGRVVRVHPVQ